MTKTFHEGFTLVELALSMAFIGILSVAVVLIISDTVASYRRGLTIAQVNSTGRDIVDDMRLAVANSSSQAVTVDCSRYYQTNVLAREKCVNDGAYTFVTVVKEADVTLKNGAEVLENVPIYGAFCTGTYSYIWNSGYYDMEEADFTEKRDKIWAEIKYKYNFGGTSDIKEVTIDGSLRENADFVPEEGVSEVSVGSDNRPFRLLKIRDTNRAVCVSVSRPEAKGEVYKNTTEIEEEGGLGNVFDITEYGVLDEQPEDLMLADTDNDLALFDLYVARPAESTSQRNMFYAVSFILGTANGGANIKANGRSCTPPTDYENENFDYCAINKFNFAIQATGGM